MFALISLNAVDGGYYSFVFFKAWIPADLKQRKLFSGITVFGIISTQLIMMIISHPFIVLNSKDPGLRPNRLP